MNKEKIKKKVLEEIDRVSKLKYPEKGAVISTSDTYVPDWEVRKAIYLTIEECEEAFSKKPSPKTLDNLIDEAREVHSKLLKMRKVMNPRKARLSSKDKSKNTAGYVNANLI